MTNPEDTLGVALTKCYFCGDDFQIIMNTRLTKKRADQVKEAHGKVIDMTPCNKCKEYMKQGIMIIVIDDSKSDSGWDHPAKGEMPNPFRTGHMSVITEEAFKRIFHGGAAEFGLKHRWVFMDITAAEATGLTEMCGDKAKT